MSDLDVLLKRLDNILELLSELNTRVGAVERKVRATHAAASQSSQYEIDQQNARDDAIGI